MLWVFSLLPFDLKLNWSNMFLVTYWNIEIEIEGKIYAQCYYFAPGRQRLFLAPLYKFLSYFKTWTSARFLLCWSALLKQWPALRGFLLQISNMQWFSARSRHKTLHPMLRPGYIVRYVLVLLPRRVIQLTDHSTDQTDQPEADQPTSRPADWATADSRAGMPAACLNSGVSRTGSHH